VTGQTCDHEGLAFLTCRRAVVSSKRASAIGLRCWDASDASENYWMHLLKGLA